ncbi:MAG: amidohydrolase family protein [Planctomycetota bacterium]
MPDIPFPLRDAHLHLIAHGAELSAVQLADCTSVDACLQRIASAAADTPAGSWIRAVGARPEAWAERRSPSADELEDAAAGRPCFVLCFDHHALSAGRSALALADMADAGPSGFIPTGADGRPTGLLLEGACKQLLRAVPKPTERDSLNHLRTAQADLQSRGFVEVHEMMAEPLHVRLLQKLEEQGDLELTVMLYATPDHFDDVRRMCAELTSIRIHFAGLKLFTDGTLNSRTAHMLTPYADPIPDAPLGTPLLSADDIHRHMLRAHDEQFDVAAHAIGDGAVRTLIDAYASIDDPTFQLRIEHAQFIDEADIERFPRHRIVASVQPSHLLTDMEAIERLMPHRASRAFPLQDLVQATGADVDSLVLFGSDTPIVDPSPFDNLQAATERRRQGMDASTAIAPEQAIDASLAWRLMRSTVGS